MKPKESKDSVPAKVDEAFNPIYGCPRWVHGWEHPLGCENVCTEGLMNDDCWPECSKMLNASKDDD